MAHSQKSIRDHARNRTHPNIDNKMISQMSEVASDISAVRESFLLLKRLLGLSYLWTGEPLRWAGSPT